MLDLALVSSMVIIDCLLFWDWVKSEKIDE